MTSQQLASTLGVKPARPKTALEHPLHEKLQTLLADPQGTQKIADFERTHQLPMLKPSPQAPHAREIRYLLTQGSERSIIIEASREITQPALWYALAGLK